MHPLRSEVTYLVTNYNDFEGNVIRIGLGYMLEPTVQEACEQQGLEMAQDPHF